MHSAPRRAAMRRLTAIAATLAVPSLLTPIASAIAAGYPTSRIGCVG